MKSPSDNTTRRLAWASFWFTVAALGVAVPMLVWEAGQSGSGWLLAVAREAGAFLVLASFPVTAVLILRKQPGNRIGWLVMAIGLVWALWGGLAETYASYTLLVNPGSLPRPDIAAIFSAVVWAPGVGLMGTFLLLLFPDGRLPSPRWRPVAWLSGLVVTAITVTVLLSPDKLEVGAAPTMPNPLAAESAQPFLEGLQAVLFPLLPVCVVACASALVMRFHRSRGVERLQLKWLAAAAAAVAALFTVSIGTSALTGALFGAQQPAWMDALDAMAFLGFLLIPAAIGTAVLKHNLYDIDLVINRALVYALLTVTLAGTYIGSVLLLQLVLNPLTQQSDLAVAASTLAVAALFRPVRARIQSAVDRRFYRSRYDTVLTLDAFAARLRHEVDLDAVGSDLRSTVDRAMHPAHLSLWIRP